MSRVIKWFKNYWYYYKFHTLVGAVVLGIVIFALSQVMLRESYDYSVYLYLSEGVTSEVERAVELAAELYGDDINGDGRVTVQVINRSYSPSDGNEEYRLAQAAGLAGELQTGKNYVFITDDYRFEELREMEVLEQTDFFSDRDGYAQSLKDSEFEQLVKAALTSAGLDESRLPELLLALRCEPASDNKYYSSYQNGRELCRSIVQNSTAAAQ